MNCNITDTITTTHGAAPCTMRRYPGAWELAFLYYIANEVTVESLLFRLCNGMA